MTENSTNKPTKQRIQIIDAARGLAVTLMVGHHVLFNIYYFFGAPYEIYMNPTIVFLRYIFIGVFVGVSGISSQYSRGNVERGAIAFTVGTVISYVTIRIVEIPIPFTILHILGTFMMFYGLTRKLWDKIPGKVAIPLQISLIIISSLALEHLSPTSDIPAVRDVLSVLGWMQVGFVTNDVQSILPWIFVFLLGAKVGEYIKSGALPKWFYETKVPFFPIVGRHALVIYVLHQPVLYGIMMLIS